MNRTMKVVASPSDDEARVPASERAYRGLKQLILNNEIAAGSQMLELEAAARLGMSRTPVREAMVRLEQEGMVELRSRHGMRVLPISADALAEIYDILTALEGMAAEMAARKGADTAELAALQHAVDEMEEALAADDLKSWSQADARFHRLLVELAGNRRLATIVEQVSDQAHRARLTTLRLRPKPVGSNRDHAALVQAIRDRDPVRARDIHEQHRRRAADMLVGLVRDLGLKQL
ncbi:MAG: GntR family transcriptional regulator [Rhabdaerophilum sp.]